MRTPSIIFGILFGFVLSRVGATDYDAIASMFLLTNLHLFGVIAAAVATCAVAFAVMKQRGLLARNGQPLALEKKPMRSGVIWGGLLFGAGWAIAGTCPGTALAQIGEGRWAGLYTFAGILGGTWLWGRLSSANQATAPKPLGLHTTGGSTSKTVGPV